VLRAHRELLKPNVIEDFDFGGAGQGNRWQQLIGTWQVSDGKFKATDWPENNEWAVATFGYCSHAFHVRVKLQRNFVGSFTEGRGGILLISNAGTRGATVTVSGYFFFYDVNFIGMSRFDNFALRGSSGVGGGERSRCLLNRPGTNMLLPRLLDVTVSEDGQYSFSFDGETVCNFTDRTHAPPSMVAVVGVRREDFDDYSWDFDRLRIRPIR
jgi:hypothetical protein